LKVKECTLMGEVEKHTLKENATHKKEKNTQRKRGKTHINLRLI